MRSVLVLSDIIMDPIAKEIKESSLGSIVIKADYTEDIVLRIMSLTEEEARHYDIIFIHSDQLFHQKDQHWQKEMLNAVANLLKRCTKKIILSNALSQSFSALPINFSFGYNWDLNKIYKDQIDKIISASNLFVFDFLNVCFKLGSINIYNYNLGHLYQMPYTKQGIKALSIELIHQIEWIFSEEKKVIILDCDNTLWKGIVGEDGADKISCNKDASGILYYNFQLFLKSKKEEGFLLCLCSKNNEQDVSEVFNKNNFPLKWNDFIVKKVNWTDKAENIRAISKELNLGIDSFIFIDDNLFELNSVKELLKGVACFHLTENYSSFIEISSSFLFRRRQILDADREKSKQYEQEQLRKEEESAFSNMNDFIESLAIKMEINLNDTHNLERLSQMTGKTNQFNFNKKSYSIDELKKFIEKGNRIYSLKVSDKYGDYGIVGLIAIEMNGNSAIMENYLMSCRALGKNIETKFYDEVLSQLKNEHIILRNIKFTKTEKNMPAQEFFKNIKI